MRDNTTANRWWLAATICCFPALFPAVAQNAPEPPAAARVKMRMGEFRTLERSERLEAVAAFLPGLLRAALFPYRWLEIPVRDEVQAGIEDRTLAGPRPARESRPAGTYELNGTVLALAERIRVDVSVTDTSDGSVAFSGFAVFTEATALQQVEELAGKLTSALAARSGVRVQGRVVCAVVAPFEDVSGDARFRALSGLLPDSLVSLLPRQELGNVRFTRSGASAAGQFDALVTGRYSAGRAEVTVSVTFTEKSGPAVTLSVVSGAEDVLETPGILARRVAEIVRGRLSESGAWRPEPLLAGRTEVEQYLAEGDRNRAANRPFAAIVLYRKALEHKPGYLDARFRLADLYVARKDYEAALTEYQAVLRDSPDSARAVYGSGKAYQAQGNDKEALACFERALRLAGGDRRILAGVHKARGDIDLLRGRHDAAIRNYLEAQKADSADMEVQRSIGRAYLAADRPAEAIRQFETAMAAFPDSQELKSDLASAYNSSAENLTNHGKYAEALPYFRKALALNPGDRAVQALALAGTGMGLAETAKIDEAVPFIEKAIALEPENERYHRILGLAWSNAGKHDKAVEAYKKALTVERTHLSLRLLGETYRRQEKYDLAEESIREAMRVRPDYANNYVALGQVYQSRGKSEAATEQFRKAIALDPANGWAHSELAFVHEGRKDLEGAVRVIQKFVAAEPDTAWARRRLAALYSDQRDYDHAIEQMRVALRITPSAGAYVTLASYYRLKKEYRNALASLQESLRLDAGFREAYQEFKRVCGEASQPEELRALLEKAARAAPKTAWLHAMLGETQYELKRFDEAAGSLSRAVALDPRDLRSHSLLGRSYRESGKDELAYTAFARAVQNNPESYPPYAELEDFSAERRWEQRYSETLEALARSYPSSVTVHVKLGNAYRNASDFTRAEETLKKAVALDPKSEWAHRVLGIMYKDREEYERALVELQRSVELSPTQWAYSGIGDAYRALGKYSEAEQAFRNALKADPDYENAYISLASMLTGQNRTAEAITLLDGAIARLPKSAPLRASLADHWRLSKDFFKAWAAGQEAVKLDPKYGYSHYVLAQILADQGKSEQAIPEARQAFQLDPGYSNTPSLLRELHHGLKRDREGMQLLEEYSKQHPGNLSVLTALGFGYHEYEQVYDPEAAYRVHQRAFQLAPRASGVKENFAESNLTTGRFDDALRLAREALSDRRLLPQQKMTMKLISIAAQILQGKAANAFTELGEFFKDYREIPEDYDRTWNYSGTKRFIRARQQLTGAERDLILALIDALEAPKKEAAAKLAKLEDSLAERFKQLK